MSYIDIIVLIFLILCFVFGFIGKAPKKVFRLFFVIISLVGGYFLSKYITFNIISQTRFSAIGLTVQNDPTLPEYLENLFRSNPDIAEIYGESTLMPLFINKIVSLLSYYITTIGLLVVVSLLGNLIARIILRKKPKHTAWKTLGLLSLIKGALLAVFLILPLIYLSPILSELPTITSSNNTRVKSFSREVKNSEIFKATNDFLTTTSVKSLNYTDSNGNEYYFYSEETGLSNLLSLYSDLKPEHAGVSSEVINKTDEEIKSTLNKIDSSATAKELLSLILHKITTETITELNLKQESEKIILLKGLVGLDDFSTVNIPDTVDALCSSYIVDAIAMNNKGLLASMPLLAQNEFKTRLQAKRLSNEISEGKYNSLMSLFDTD